MVICAPDNTSNGGEQVLQILISIDLGIPKEGFLWIFFVPEPVFFFSIVGMRQVLPLLLNIECIAYF